MSMSINQAKVVRDGAKTECTEALGALQAAIQRDVPALLATFQAVAEHVEQAQRNVAMILGGGIQTDEVEKAHGMASSVKENVKAVHDKVAGEISGNMETVRQRIVGLMKILDEI